MSRRGIIFILCFTGSLFLNAYFFVREIPFVEGGGMSASSPGDAYTGFAQSYVNKNPLAANCDIVGGRLEVRAWPKSIADDPLISLTVSPPGIDNEMGYRMLEDAISWSQDSATVTFDLPHALITITPKKPSTDVDSP